MIFANLSPQDAIGAVLVHSVKIGSHSFKKGRVLSADDALTLITAGVAAITCVRLTPDDVPEDTAAAVISASLVGPGLTASAPFTGRANLIAEQPGVIVIDVAKVDALNALDECITLATVDRFACVEARQLVATVKVIPFAAPRQIVEEALTIAHEAGPLIRLAPFSPKQVALIQTTLPGMKASLLDKTEEVTEARVASLGSSLTARRRCAHDAQALSRELRAVLADGCDMILIAGASAVADRRDVLPTGIEAAGGAVRHLGMPVDPGNLLLLAVIAGRPVLGLPGCARSPKLNGFDWVLQRLCADLPVTRTDIMAMGVGGLLKEIALRPQPREGGLRASTAPTAPKVAALVMAAGKSSRMGQFKLLMPVDGTPMIAHTVDALLASSVTDVIVVTGREAAGVRAALSDRPVRIAHNPDFAEGLSTSLKAGLAALPADADAFLVALGDMPKVTADDINRLIAAYDPGEGRLICVPTFDGKAGNPILWDRRFLEAMRGLSGDTGARSLLLRHGEAVAETPVTSAGVLIDVDTPEALAALEVQGS
jgi:molybdenum cofactor cytidylyltransferase